MSRHTPATPSRPDDALPSDIAADTSTAPRWAAGHVIVTVVVALVLATLLNAQDLLATAQRQPFGWQRSAAVAVASPIARASAAIGFDRPRNAIDAALGRTDTGDPEDQPAEEPIIAAPTGAATDAPGSTPTPTGVASDQPSPATASPATPTAPTTTEPGGPLGLDRGPITTADPLEVYIAGDSMVEIQFGTALEDLAGDTGLIDTLGIDFDRGSGLSRPDYIDWPARLATASTDVDPDVMVVFFGGNDAQPLEIDGAVHDVDEPEWQAEYRSRVAGLMDQLVDAGSRVYWMGLPIPSSDTLAPKFQIMNSIYEEEAATRDWVVFQPLWDLFTDANGNYSEFLVDDEGDTLDMRFDDGIHLTTPGAYRAARVTLATITQDFDIDVPPDE